jgi:hypothetical protein
VLDGIPDMGHRNVTNIVCRSDKCLDFHYCSQTMLTRVRTLDLNRMGIRCQMECGKKSNPGKNILEILDEIWKEYDECKKCF